MATAAIVARNVKITGFLNEEKMVNLVNGAESSLLFFKLGQNFAKNGMLGQNNVEFDRGNMTLTIRKPCIIGYIVEPFPAFPLCTPIQWQD
jgi:hypothetical protein